MTVLRYEEIEKSYGDTKAVRGVTFDVPSGEVFGLLGPNGAGKTTLIRVLMDIIRPDAGRVIVNGEPLERRHLDRIGYLPEERGLYTKQKVLDVMTYFGSLKGLTRDEARRRGGEWLAHVGLDHVATQRVEQLSKGMSQKVQIAVTLMNEPELCVLDEPFSGLDPVNIRLVRRLIRERRERGLTTILSTHQMNMVEELCDRVALIDKGALVVYGTVADVRRQYSLPEVRIGVSGELPELVGAKSVHREDDGTWRVLLADGVDGADRGATELLAGLVRSGARVERFEKILAPMEDIFVRVVQGGDA